MMLGDFFDGLHVFQDPGHGGGTNLGCSLGDVLEKDWTLAFAQDLGSALAPWGVRQLFSRQADIEPGYGERAELARSFGADISLIHHVNANDDPEVHGLITYCFGGRPEAFEFARTAMRCAPAGLHLPGHGPAQPCSRRWTRGAETVLRPYEDRGLQAVLIEYGFSTNPGDLKILLSATHRPALITSVLAGIARTLEITR